MGCTLTSPGPPNGAAQLGSGSQRRAVWGATLVVFAAAWVALAQWARPHDIADLLGPTTTAHTPVGLGVTTVMWLTMMIAMMLPTVLPWLDAYAVAVGPHPRGYRRIAAFAAGYMTVWTGFSLFAALVQVTLVQHGMLGGLTMRAAAPLAAALLVGAGLYELSPAKGGCLEHCRSPLGFFLLSWRGGASGALRMGLTHAGFCVGCCWALMLLSFALGTMNLLWMAVLTLVLCLEKLMPYGQQVRRSFGMLLIIWGAWLGFNAA